LGLATIFYCLTFETSLFVALRYGTRKTRETRSTIELWLLSSEGLNNHDNRGTIEDVSQATDTETAVTSEMQKKRILQGGDLLTVRPEPTSGRELTKRRENTTEEYRRIYKRILEAGVRSRQQ
jgi:hypothetical protein